MSEKSGDVVNLDPAAFEEADVVAQVLMPAGLGAKPEQDKETPVDPEEPIILTDSHNRDAVIRDNSSVIAEGLSNFGMVVAAALAHKIRANSDAQNVILQSMPPAPQHTGAGQGGGIVSSIASKLMAPGGNAKKMAELQNLRSEGVRLGYLSDEINRLKDLFVSEMQSYNSAVFDLNSVADNHLTVARFDDALSDYCSRNNQPRAKVLGRISDPFDKSPDLESLKGAAKTLNAHPDFEVYAKRVETHAIGAEISLNLLRDKLNNPEFMSDAGFATMAASLARIVPEIAHTRFPVQNCNVDRENSSLKSSIEEFAVMAREMAKQMAAAISLAFGGPSASAGGPGMSV